MKVKCASKILFKTGGIRAAFMASLHKRKHLSDLKLQWSTELIL